MSLKDRAKALEHDIGIEAHDAAGDLHREETFKDELQRVLARIESSQHHGLPRHGIDIAWGHPNPLGLKRAGVTFVCRYLSHDESKNLTVAEVDGYHSVGIDVVTIWETTANRALDGYDAGVQDAKVATEEAHAVGQLTHAPIFFAVDFDLEGAEQENQVEGYFKGCCDVLTASRVGCYGGFNAVQLTHDRRCADYRWQTLAWSKGEWYAHAHLRQVRINVVVAGAECDLDIATAPNFGQW